MMRASYSVRLILTSLAIGCVAASVRAQQVIIPPDERILAELAKFDSMTAGPAAEEIGHDAGAMLIRLRDMAKSRGPGYMGAQLVHYAVQSRNELAWAVLGHLVKALPVQAYELVAGVAPFLDGPDVRARHVASSLLDAAAKDDCVCISFDSFKPHLDSPSLVAWMIREEPEKAMRVILDARQTEASATGARTPNQLRAEREDIIWALRVVDQAIWHYRHQAMIPNHPRDDSAAHEQLDRLSRSSDWWVRLYAAEIMRQYSFLRSQNRVMQLSKDDNEYVRAPIEEISAPR